MTEPRIALDLEGVLADTHLAVVEQSNILTLDDFKEFGFEDERKEQHFLELLATVWDDYLEDIPPAEKNMAQCIKHIRDMYPVDLVTNTTGEPERVLDWLEMYGIDELDGYRFPGFGTDKSELSYEIYIDDKGTLIDEVPLLYFMTTPWNRERDGEINRDVIEETDGDFIYYDMTRGDPMVHGSIRDGRNTVVRVDSLEQVEIDLTHRHVAGATAI